MSRTTMKTGNGWPVSTVIPSLYDVGFDKTKPTLKFTETGDGINLTIGDSGAGSRWNGRQCHAKAGSSDTVWQGSLINPIQNFELTLSTGPNSLDAKVDAAPPPPPAPGGGEEGSPAGGSWTAQEGGHP
jgi:hypothetical protein